MAPRLKTMLLSAVVVIFALQTSTASHMTERIHARRSSSVWKTLTGTAPLIIARGGLSGLLPDQTPVAYKLAIETSLPDAVMFCDLQLTKDGEGLCRTNLRLEASTNIADIYPNQNNTYLVNGRNVTGWFSIDFTAEQLLSNVSARQALQSRTTAFDDSYPLLLLDQLADLQPAAIWLNVQNSKLFEQHKLSVSSYVLSISKVVTLNYISSPEVGFLRGIARRFRRSKTKIILRFLDKQEIEPSTNETYGSLLHNLTLVKAFASGILVPKNYIWPVDSHSFLQPHTGLVQDAHLVGLEVFAADFANDAYPTSYNYSFDPIREYLQFVNNGDFAVDGVLTDFSVTASEAIACYTHNRNRASPGPGKPLIIAHDGSSGDYPGCTDIAYEAAIRDGADYIGCSVQMTKDGIPICRESPDLLLSTTVTSDSSFYPSRMTKVSDIQTSQGIFTFDLTWKEIQSLKPSIFSPFTSSFNITRSPAYANAGKFMALSDFLDLAKNQSKVGILINIQHARYLASARKLNVMDATVSALKTTGYDNMTKRVRIQSDESAVLLELKKRTSFQLVYKVEETDVTIPNSTIKQIKEFADTVTLSRGAVFPFDIFPSGEVFLLKTTDVVRRMHLHNISVFISRLRNEFVSLAFDYYADPTMEINSFVQISEADGLMTEFPATAKAYLGNACLQLHKGDDYSMPVVVPGDILEIIPPSTRPPAPPPGQPLLTVQEPPLPSVTPAPASVGSAPAPANAVHAPNAAVVSGQPNIACHFMQSVSLPLLTGLLILILNCK